MICSLIKKKKKDLQVDPLSQGLFIIQRLDKLPITITRIGEGTFEGGDPLFRL